MSLFSIPAVLLLPVLCSDVSICVQIYLLLSVLCSDVSICVQIYLLLSVLCSDVSICVQIYILLSVLCSDVSICVQIYLSSYSMSAVLLRRSVSGANLFTQSSDTECAHHRLWQNQERQRLLDPQKQVGGWGLISDSLMYSDGVLR